MLRKILKPVLTTILFNNAKPPVRNYIPRRALLYVPAHDLKKVLRAFVTDDVDGIILDCEDGVPINKKADARNNIREILNKGKPQRNRNYEFIARVNPPSTDMLKEDLRVILNGKHLPDTICLPKVETIEDLTIFAGVLDNSVNNLQSKIGVMIGIESAMSVVNLVDICRQAASILKCEKCSTPVALLFGSDNFYASIGAKKTKSTCELTYARQKFVTVAKAFGLQAIDAAYLQYKDNEGLKKQAELAAQMGFSGKQVIHQGQIEITQRAFLPTDKEIHWAQSIMKAYHKHEKEGVGVFTYKGSMVDMPTVRQAQNILELINAIMIQK